MILQRVFSLGGQQSDRCGHTRPHSLVLLGLCRQVFKYRIFSFIHLYFCGFVCILQYIFSCESWSRILGRNSDKSFKSFPSCYSQSPLQLCLRFLFLQEENLIENHTPSLCFKKYIQKPQVWKLSGVCPEISKWLYMDSASGNGLTRLLSIPLRLSSSLLLRGVES